MKNSTTTTISSTAKGKAVLNPNNEEESMYKNTWISVDSDGSFSIARDYRHQLNVDGILNTINDFDIKTGAVKTIPFKYQELRIAQIKELINESRKEAHYLPKRYIPFKEENALSSILIQKEEADNVFYERLEERKGKIIHLANRIAEWVHEEILLDVYVVKKNKKDECTKSGYNFRKFEINRLAKDYVARRNCPIVDVEYKLVKLTSQELWDKEFKRVMEKRTKEAKETLEDSGVVFNSKEFQAALPSREEWLDFELKWNKQSSHGFALEDDSSLKKIILKKVFPKYTKMGYSYIGANPDSGILVFVKEPKVHSANDAQKLAKILLRGGVQLTALEETFKAKLKAFPTDSLNSSKKGGARDGVFMVIRRHLFNRWLGANGLKGCASAQGHLFLAEVTAAKGLLATEDAGNPEEMKVLLGNNQAVIDLESFNCLYGLKAKEGDIVELPVSCLWIMDPDTSCRPIEMRLGVQTVDRASPVHSDYFFYVNMEIRKKILAAAKSNDSRDILKLVSKFGMPGVCREANLPYPLKTCYTHDKNGKIPSSGKRIKGHVVDPYLRKILVQEIIKSNAKGHKIVRPEKEGDRRAYYQRLMHDNSLSIPVTYLEFLERTLKEYEKEGKSTKGKEEEISNVKSSGLLKKGLPGVAVPKSMGLSIGDKIIIVTYPVLNAGYGDETCSIFTAEVEKLTDNPGIELHRVVAKYALRDEDGDMIFGIVPSKEDIEKFPKLLTTGIGFYDIEGRVKDGSVDHSKADVFNKKLEHGNPKAISEACLEVSLKIASAVGIASNRKTGEEILLNGREMSSPTKEPVRCYLSGVEQYPIYNKKHGTREEYSLKAHDIWSQAAFPELWERNDFNDGYHFVVPPEMKCRKVGTDATMETVKKAVKEFDKANLPGTKWMDFIRLGTELEVTKEGFVTREYYQDIALELFYTFFDTEKPMITNRKTLKNLEGVIDTVVSSHSDIMGLDSSKKWKMAAEYLFKQKLIIRHTFSSAERLYMYILLLNQAPFVWTQVCDMDFLKVVSFFIDNFSQADNKALMDKLSISYRNVIKTERSYDLIQKKMLGDIVNTRFWVHKNKGETMPIIQEQEVIHVEDYKTEISGQVVELDAKTYCLDGRYKITGIEEAISSKTNKVLESNLNVQLQHING